MVFTKIIHTDHLKKVKESYVVHLGFAVRVCFGLLFLCVISLIHGLFPFIFTSTVSKQVKKLSIILEERQFNED